MKELLIIKDKWIQLLGALFLYEISFLITRFSKI